MAGTFLVSLDFELFWGMAGTVPLEQYEKNIRNGREAIPKVLALFDKYGIHATWATVGFQFAQNRAELLSFLPPEALRPSYQDRTSDTYRFFDTLGEDEASDPCHYSPGLLREIAKHPHQEIASHTFSHYYCREPGQTTEQFRADMAAAKAIAAAKGYDITSVVFPRDMSTPAHSAVLRELGFTAYRDEADDWIHNGKFPRALRRSLILLDVYFPLTGHSGFQPRNEGGIVRLVGNRQFRYFFHPLSFLEGMKVQRIKRQMRHAAKTGCMYHLWWHPHNLGDSTEALLAQLEDIFRCYADLQKQYGMESKNMREAAEAMRSL